MIELSIPVHIIPTLVSRLKRAVGKKAKVAPPPEPRKEPNRDAFDKAADFCRTHKKPLIIGAAVGAAVLAACLLKKYAGGSVSQVGLINIGQININT